MYKSCHFALKFKPCYVYLSIFKFFILSYKFQYEYWNSCYWNIYFIELSFFCRLVLINLSSELILIMKQDVESPGFLIKNIKHLSEMPLRKDTHYFLCGILYFMKMKELVYLLWGQYGWNFQQKHQLLIWMMNIW